MNSLTTLLRTRLFLFWAIGAAIVALTGASIPMFETIGYEYGLLSSLLCALATGHMAACYPSRVRGGSLETFPYSRLPMARHYMTALYPGLILCGLMLLVILANGIRVRICNLQEGLLFYLLMPVSSTAMATAMGLAAGVVTPNARRASVIWFTTFILALLSAFFSFYATPAVHIFNPLFGYYPGVLYDTLIPIDTRLVTYRLGTLIQILAAVTATSLLYDNTLTRHTAPVRTRMGQLFVVIILTGMVVGMQVGGHALGHRTSRSDLENHLSVSVKTDGMALYFPKGTDKELVSDIVKDARFSLHQVRTYLGVKDSGDIAVFFFKNRKDKQRMMGAGNTNVAKPWRQEVYVILETPPHPVLRHELAHAVSKTLGTGPFAISGKSGGLWPNPGLIEGLASAAQGPRGDLTLHQWSAAMLAEDLLPKVEQLFGLGFFDLAARRAYVAAGSFCEWLHDTYGKGALRKAYQTADLKQATGTSLDTLDAAWRKHLKTIPLSPMDKAAAKHRFDRPPIIRTMCVHEVARLNKEAKGRFDKGDKESAREALNTAHEKSGESTATQRRLFFTLTEHGTDDEVRQMAKALQQDPAVSAVDKLLIDEIITDLDAEKTPHTALSQRYRKIADHVTNAAQKRRLQVKAHLAEIEVSDRRLFRILSAQPASSPISGTLAALIISDTAKRYPNDPICIYLHARQFFNEKDYSTALSLLHVSFQNGLEKTSPSIKVAGRMLQAMAHYHLGQLRRAKESFEEIAKDPTVRLGDRALARDQVERAAFELGPKDNH